MCGIAGFSGDVAEPKSLLNAFNSALAHRGPDNSSILIGNNRGFSHSRLSIIDLSSNSNQPIESESIELVFNGEIYNWADLAKEVFPEKSIGSDTQLLREMLSSFKLEYVVNLIRGIYAISFFDKKTNEMTLFRDEFGTKPLYYVVLNEVLYFASEIKAFLRIPGWKPRINQDHLKHYLYFQNCFKDCTLFDGVFLVPQNSYITFRGATLKRCGEFRKYNASISTNSLEENLSELETLLEQSIKRNLNSDVEIASYLSGGLDSSLIVSQSVKRNPHMKTFTVGFDTTNANSMEMNFDESAIAKQVAQTLGVDNFSMQVNSHLMSLVVDDVSWAIEDPRVGQSYPNFYAGHLASSKVKVCLSGAGGDELFGGYPWRYSPVLQHSSRGDQLQALFQVWKRLGEIDELAALCKMKTEDFLNDNFNHLLNSLQKINPDSTLTLEDLLEFERQTFLHGLLLVEDKVSMHHGLEVRVPFLDEDLSQFARTVSPNHKILSQNVFDMKFTDQMDHHSKELAKNSSKIILRELAREKIPKVMNLRKQGFSAPDATWFKNDDHGIIKRLFSRKDSLLWQTLDYYVAEKLVREHFLGVKNRRLLIWSLLTLESTFRQFDFT